MPMFNNSIKRYLELWLIREIPIHTQQSGSKCYWKTARDAEGTREGEASRIADGNTKWFGHIGKLRQVPQN